MKHYEEMELTHCITDM